MASYSDAAAAQEAVLAAESSLDADDRAEALKLLKAEWKRSPKNVENLYALVRVCADSNEWDTGLPACRELAELAPNVAEYQYMLGNALFSTIDKVSFINKGARAKAGLNAYKKAIELEPDAHGCAGRVVLFLHGGAGDRWWERDEGEGNRDGDDE